MRKKIQNYVEIVSNIMRKKALIKWGKKAGLCGEVWSNADPLGLSATFQCTGCRVNTMSTSVLPRILALYSQNEHHFCKLY